MRTHDRKLVCYYGHGGEQPGSSDEVLPPTWELFDLEADPYELLSVHDDPSYARDLAALRAELSRLVAELGDDLELPQPD